MTTGNTILTGTDRDLTTLSIAELTALYRRWPERRRARLAEGRDAATQYYESRIVGELRRRRPLTPADSLSKARCLADHRRELQQLALLLRLPLGHTAESDTDTAAIPPCRMPEALERLGAYDTVARREALMDLHDRALTYLRTAPADDFTGARIAATLLTLDSRRIARCPAWVRTRLTAAVDTVTADIKAAKTGYPDKSDMSDRSDNSGISDAEREMVIPLLTQTMLSGDPTPARRATRILNRLYRRCLADPTHPAFAADCRLIIRCSDYVTRFSPRRLAAAWNAAARHHLDTATGTTTLSDLLSITSLLPATDRTLARQLETALEKHSIHEAI